LLQVEISSLIDPLFISLKDKFKGVESKANPSQKFNRVLFKS